MIVHGDGTRGERYRKSNVVLVRNAGDTRREVFRCSLRSRASEIAIEGVADGFKPVLRLRPALGGADEFDGKVHSTRVVVVRAWLIRCAPCESGRRIFTVISPPTFGPHLDRHFRSWLDSSARGSKDPFDPDGSKDGDEFCDGIEVTSPHISSPAHCGLSVAEKSQGSPDRTPYVCDLPCDCDGARRLISETRADCTVRWTVRTLHSGTTTLNHITQPFQRGTRRTTINPFRLVDMPLSLIRGLGHRKTVCAPSRTPVELARRELIPNPGVAKSVGQSTRKQSPNLEITQ